MASTLDDYRRKLINKISLSSSSEEVRRFSNTAIRSLIDHKVHGYIIVRFIDKTINDLHEFNLLNKDERQWSNISTALEHFTQLRKKFESSTIS
ncbi:MAG: hypothetical protein ABI675_24650 [Chitinophagaceae bacterium]